MSNRRRPRRLPEPVRSTQPAPLPGPGETYAVQPAVVFDRLDLAAIQTARQVTHDHLVHIWGRKRRSGIWWTDHIGAEGAERYREIHRLLGETVPADVDAGLDDNPRLYVVVAWAIVEQGDPVAAPEPGGKWYDADGTPS